MVGFVNRFVFGYVWYVLKIVYELFGLKIIIRTAKELFGLFLTALMAVLWLVW